MAKRYRMNRKASRKVFKRTSGTKAVNDRNTPMRGGWRF